MERAPRVPPTIAAVRFGLRGRIWVSGVIDIDIGVG